MMDFRRMATGLAALALISVSAAGARAADPLDLAGRWKEVRSKSPDDFKMGMIEFAPCGESMCGVRIDAQGKCGAPLSELRPTEARSYSGARHPHHVGPITWRGRGLELYVWRYEDTIRLYASEGRSPFSRVPMPAFDSTFERVGDAKCKPPVS